MSLWINLFFWIHGEHKRLIIARRGCFISKQHEIVTINISSWSCFFPCERFSFVNISYQSLRQLAFLIIWQNFWLWGFLVYCAELFQYILLALLFHWLKLHFCALQMVNVSWKFTWFLWWRLLLWRACVKTRNRYLV